MCSGATLSGIDTGPQTAMFTRPTWGRPGSCPPQVGPMLAPWILLSRGLPLVSCFYLGSGSLCGRSECLPTLTEKSYRYGNFMYQYTIFHTLLTMLCKTFTINSCTICFAIKCTSLDHSVTCLVLTGWIFFFFCDIPGVFIYADQISRCILSETEISFFS